jgi:hypothetical protein
MHVREPRLAVVAIALVLVAQIGGAAHEASVRHVACAHGELIEAPDIDASPSDESRLVAAGGRADHDHCAISAALRSHGTSATPAAAITAAVVVATVTASEPVATPTTRALYRIAPKTSPPHAVL